MKKIAITAPTGMLGSAVYNELKDKYELILIYRSKEKLKALEKAYGGTSKHKQVIFDLNDIYQDYLEGFNEGTFGPHTAKLIKEIGEIDTFINCAGIIKPYSTDNPTTTLFINGALPHILSSHYKEKLIQITTDCAYNGTEKAPYDENSQKTSNDLYGLSKSLGEPYKDSLVLRTSIIGHEIAGYVSLIAWFKKQEGETIKGFSTHLWNGITTKQFGKICDKIINNRNNYPKNGMFHIFSNDVTKLEMVEKFKTKFKVNVTIEEATPSAVDRRLRTIHDVCDKLNIPSFDEMINEL
ncbi:MAG: sugar nucleotide-binding protein [Candidatus Kerfeldbacteria bacterium]|jgi:dTDP-4-dehydrorhamnose reductase